MGFETACESEARDFLESIRLLAQELRVVDHEAGSGWAYRLSV